MCSSGQISAGSAVYLGRLDNVAIAAAPATSHGDRPPTAFYTDDECAEPVAGASGDGAKCEPLAEPLVYRPSEMQLMDRIEWAQLRGELADAQTAPRVRVAFGEHGMKIVAVADEDVLDRASLQSLSSAVSFDSCTGESLAAVKVCTSLGRPAPSYSAHVFHMHSQADADELCADLERVFDRLEAECEKQQSTDDKHT